ncbi:hypothetical protein Tco_0019256 [Tanacetum coccineum]
MTTSKLPSLIGMRSILKDDSNKVKSAFDNVFWCLLSFIRTPSISLKGMTYKLALLLLLELLLKVLPVRQSFRCVSTDTRIGAGHKHSTRTRQSVNQRTQGVLVGLVFLLGLLALAIVAACASRAIATTSATIFYGQARVISRCIRCSHPFGGILTQKTTRNRIQVLQFLEFVDGVLEIFYIRLVTNLHVVDNVS